MKITKEWLKEKNACIEGFDWFAENHNTGIESNELLKYFIDKKEHIDWANWLITRIMTKQQCVKYAVFAAEQVIDIFEKKYPNDKRPRQAIEAAKKWLDNPTEKTEPTPHPPHTTPKTTPHPPHPPHTPHPPHPPHLPHTSHTTPHALPPQKKKHYR